MTHATHPSKPGPHDHDSSRSPEPTSLLSSDPSDQASHSPLPEFADVLVPRRLNRSFTYAIPVRLRGRLKVGSRVRVPFGSTTLQGMVIALAAQPPHAPRLRGPDARRLREILAILDEAPETELSQDLLDLTRQVADYYLAPWGQCLRLILPSPPNRSQSRRYVITDLGRVTQARSGSRDGPDRLSPTACEILTRLVKAPKGLTQATLRRTVAGPVHRTLSTLRRRGWVNESEQEDERANVEAAERLQQALRDGSTLEPISRSDQGYKLQGPKVHPPPQSAVPQAWRVFLRTALDQARHDSLLLQASTSRRTACLIEAAEDTLAHRRTVLIITPEIARASAVAELARARWGERVVLLHSGMAPSGRAETWRRISAGRTTVVVGTRSAVFAPLRSIGLVAVDQEEDPSLKEETEPHYHAREVSAMRARQHDAALLLSSAHPSLETLHALSPDRAFTLGTAGNSATYPAVQAIDLRQTPYGTILSQPLIAGISDALQTSHGRLAVVLFLNRKGFASALLCRDCGAVPHCPQCSVALTFYKRPVHLSCHYCGTWLPLPDLCPSCKAARLEPVGFGTERLAEEVRRLFPDARIGKLDRDAACTPAQAEATRKQASAGELDILIGTQMLLQGPPLPAVRLVGLPHADAGLQVPDFRSAERTYHTLLDAAGLALPAEAGGRVLLQTYLPIHHAIAAVLHGQPAIFYDQESAFRQALGYPPYARLIGLRVSGKHATRVKKAAEEWGGRLKAKVARVSATHEISILGPIPAPVAQLRGRARWQLLVKSVHADGARETVRRTLVDIEKKGRKGGLKYDVDVDPVEMT
jgi:primosomal protein N' (replication factor Y)